MTNEARLVIRHRPWAEPLTRPPMSNTIDRRPGLSMTNRYLERHGRRVIPVSGELHYSRVRRERWVERLGLMKSGGVTVATTYVFWLHHEERRGQARFDGNLDVGAFLDHCQELGLDVVLRIGPWCHGEARNGGLPDWVAAAPVRHRTNDPAYLELVREWFGRLAAAIGDRVGPTGPIIGVQIENELYDQPDHIRTLKRLAREAGLSAPVWTATAWGSAQLPEGDVLPVYGGYGDGFWSEADRPWHPTFREHFFFSHVWDDPGIGADLREHAPERPRTPSPDFPVATCELGGGMALAYHRRPWLAGLDVAAIAQVKLGSGSAWQGYYMYAGSTNPTGAHGMQESHASGYPNDLPRLSYDFHAPVGEAGTLADSHAELRIQHAFLAAFGDRLAAMPSSLPETLPSDYRDVTTLRGALRSDGSSGFLFLAWHQPYEALSPYQGARFKIELDDGALVLPSRPVTIPAGTLARWPLRLEVGQVVVEWATASAGTMLDDRTRGSETTVPTLVLIAEAGIDTEVALPRDVLLDSEDASADRSGDIVVHRMAPGSVPMRLRGPRGEIDLLILDSATARTAWVVDTGPRRRLLLSADPLTWRVDGVVNVRSEACPPELLEYDTAERRFVPVPLRSAGPPTRSGEAGLTLRRPASSSIPSGYGARRGRQSAPTAEEFDGLAAVYDVDLPDWAHEHPSDVFLELGWSGDVAELRVDGHASSDRFWDGSQWVLNVADVDIGPRSAVSLHVLPLAVDSPISLPGQARDRLAAADEHLLAVDSARVRETRVWTEEPPRAGNR